MKFDEESSSLEQYFEPFRKQTIGIHHRFDGPAGTRRLIYADWIASGRLYEPIEDLLSHQIGPLVGNTHTESSVTGTVTTKAYHKARDIIKHHVNADTNDILIAGGAGMTAMINKLQRMLGLRIPSQARCPCNQEISQRPVVFITHMEHHSNHTSWVETLAEVVVVPPDENGLVSPANLNKLLDEYDNRPLKIGSFTACSNVTGIITPYHELARVMHKRKGGFCIVDFAASAPYVNIDMHPKDPAAHLDAVVFSPHKFLGGPGSSGVLVINKEWYGNPIPDCPGGGTVEWTNPWGERRYFANPEVREDGGTPPFLQTMRSALAIRLKERMGVTKLLAREKELLERVLPALRSIPGLHILDDNVPAPHRLGILSFYIENIHYNLLVHLLSDRFGIQVRGGCSCAGTYGHYLLHVTREQSKQITSRIDKGDYTSKPGWVRLSLHPTMTNEEADYITKSLAEAVLHHKQWSQDYIYDSSRNEFIHHQEGGKLDSMVDGWFELPTVNVKGQNLELQEEASDSLQPQISVQERDPRQICI